MKHLYDIKPISNHTAKQIVIQYHYLKRTCPATESFGLYLKTTNELVGVIIYGNSASTTLRKGVCGIEYQHDVYELTRLWLKDNLIKNTASYFISATVNQVKKPIIITYADPSQGHLGTIYQACNWIYTGLSSKFVDPVLKNNPNAHHSSFAKNMTNEDIKNVYGDEVEFKKRVRKHRYVYFQPHKKHLLMKKLNYKIHPYPKKIEGHVNPLTQTRCKICQIVKNNDQFELLKQLYKGKQYRRKQCFECYKTKKNRQEIKDRNNAKRRTDEFREQRNAFRRTDKGREQNRKYDTTARQNNPLIKVKQNLRNRLRIALRVKKWFKTTKFYEYIGCTQDELKQHLESKFTEGMTWENYGKWEIDHIIPLSSAVDINQMMTLSHYSNLQPLWKKDNIIKSNKY